MKLLSVRITNFQCIQDSNEFEMDDITCLVGKNESGKSALLQALYRLNPVVDLDKSYNMENDYPRKYFVEFESQIDSIEVDSTVVEAKFILEDFDLQNIAKEFGENFLIDCEQVLTVKKGYLYEIQYSGLKINEEIAVDHVNGMITEELNKIDTYDWYYEDEYDEHGSNKRVDMSDLDVINSYITSERLGEYEELERLFEISDDSRFMEVLHETLNRYLPKFMYFDEYYQMKGMENLDSLQERINNNNLLESDHPLLGMLKLAGLKVDQLLKADNTNSLITKLEAAAKKLTAKFANYWSQNEYIKIKFDIRPGLPRDPQGMNNGYNILGLVEDTKSEISTSLGSRSKGFIWFFSFLAWYEEICEDYDNIILLLDEPGVSLHASAQSDLLNFFETEFNHQIIYTTHSPFMINPAKFNGVRIVQNNSMENESLNNPEIRDAANYEIDSEDGTKVTSDIYKAGKDTIFPLQGALGYDITQSLFVGPNCLIVEGLSDWHYLDCLSSYLQEKGEVGLSADWTITPVGGLGNVSTFVSLLGSQVGLNIAVLLDYNKNDRQKIDNLYKENILRRNNLILYSDYIENLREADVEDMFQPNFYIRLLNDTFDTSIKVKDLQLKSRPIISRLDHLARQNSIIHSQLSYNQNSFNHNRPAKYFASNFDEIKTRLQDTELDRFRKLFESINSLL